MSTGSMRVAARRRLIERIKAAAPDGVGVYYGLPGEFGEPSAIYGGKVEGESRVRAMREGRKPRTDTFTIDVVCAAGPGSAVDPGNFDNLDPAGHQLADEHCLTLVQLVDDTLADDPRLGGLDGGLFAVVGDLEGPTPQTYTDGAGSIATVKVEFQSRLR